MIQVSFLLAALFILVRIAPLTFEVKVSTHTIPHSTCSTKRLSKFKESLSEIASKQHSYKKIRRGLDGLRKASRRIVQTTEVSKQNKKLNRNSAHLCFDSTRSCQDLPDFYINANDVTTPVQSYMVCQGPLAHTVGDFWKAVLHNHSDTIVTLVMAIENGKEKCASYWTIPSFSVEGWTITKGDEKVLATSAYIPSQRIVQRSFTASKGSEIRNIEHIHYENWPDGKACEIELFITLLDIVDKTSSSNPITVHCSAGIGRSGTFVAAHSLRKELRSTQASKKVRVNIPKAVYLLREQRLGLVSSAQQYTMIYKTIAREYAPREHPFFILSCIASLTSI